MRTHFVFTGFAPNLTSKDVRTSLSFLLFPWKWISMRKGNESTKAEQSLETYFGSNARVATFDSGRSSLLVALQALGIQKGDEVILQAFTCVVVVNAIKRSGATPIFVDIENTYNIDVEKVEKSITQKTKVIIIQHTFGTPGNIEQISVIAKKYNLFVIEDCAHSLGASYQNKLVGTFGDIAMFSFGTDKVISSVRGGALLTKDASLADKIKKIQTSLPHMPLIEVLRHLVYLPIFAFGKKTYGIVVGKIVLYIAKQLRITSRIIERCEKRGEWPESYPAKLPNALASILNNQCTQIDYFNEHRKKIAHLYTKHIKNSIITLPVEKEGGIYLRYPIQIEQPRIFVRKAKEQGLILGDWYNTVVAPADTLNSETFYETGSCKNAEDAAKHIVNLPTDIHVTEQDAHRIIAFCNSYA